MIEPSKDIEHFRESERRFSSIDDELGVALTKIPQSEVARKIHLCGEQARQRNTTLTRQRILWMYVQWFNNDEEAGLQDDIADLGDLHGRVTTGTTLSFSLLSSWSSSHDISMGSHTLWSTITW